MLGAPIVRRDAIRLALHGKRYEPLAEPIVKGLSIVMVRSLFEAGHKAVICDETSYSRHARNALRDDAVWDTVFIPIDTPPEECIRRAHATNQSDLEPVIKAMWERREPLDYTTERVIHYGRELNAFIQSIKAEADAEKT